MKLIIQQIIVLMIMMQVPSASAFSFWKTCVDYDDFFSHHIVDTNTLEITNAVYVAEAIVQCVSMEGRHAFSFYETGHPLHPDSAVTFPNREDGEVCQGDHILVYDDDCSIISMRKMKLDHPEVQKYQERKKSDAFIIYQRKEEVEKLLKE